MIAHLDPRQSRLLALLLSVAVLVLVALAVALPVSLMNQRYDELISGMHNQLDIYQRVARHGDQYQARYRQLQRLLRQDRRYLQSGTESLATAELQRIAKQKITGHRGEILSTQVLQSGDEQGFQRISIRIRMKCELAEMVKIFHALESNKPYLFVDNVTIRSHRIARRRLPTNKEIEKAMSQLDIDFQLSGYMRGDQA